jgi:predicted ester cyclase
MTLGKVVLRDFAERYTAAWCSQGPASVAEFFSPNGTLSVNGIPAVGRTAIIEVARGFMAAFPNMVLTMTDLVASADHTTYHWTLDGHNTEPGGTGKRVRISGYEKWKFGSDGLIAESQGYFDEAEYQRQIQHGFDESKY